MIFQAKKTKKIQPIAQGQMLKKTSTVNNVREKLAEQVAPFETLHYLSQSLKKIKYDSGRKHFFLKAKRRF